MRFSRSCGMRWSSAKTCSSEVGRFHQLRRARYLGPNGQPRTQRTSRRSTSVGRSVAAPTITWPKACWLYVGPAATELALLGETSGPAAAELPLVSSGSAVADVSGGLGTAQGVLVDYQRHAAGEKLAFVEQWPNGDVRAYVGQTISAGDIELWPAAPTS